MMVYATLSATPFVSPVNPGPTLTIPTQTTDSNAIIIIHNHREELCIWRKYQNVDAACLKTATHQRRLPNLPPYPATQAYRIPSRQLIAHLLQACGNITPSDIATNDQKFRSAYGPAQPIELLFSQNEDRMDFANAGGSPYTVAQAISNSYVLTFNTGLFQESGRE
jgi:hypothetical protein